MGNVLRIGKTMTLTILLFLVFLAEIIVIFLQLYRKPTHTEIHTPVNLASEALERHIKDIPNKVLQSIQGSSNVHKGALGELIGYIELRASYDRIIPIGNIVDFICIKFPSSETEGAVDFIEVKSGKARLDKDQKKLQQLIKDKRLNFVTFRVTDSKVSNEGFSK